MRLYTQVGLFYFMNIQCLEGEVWKEIPDYEGLYMVSNMGRVKSLDRIVPFKRGGPNATKKVKGQILIQGLTNTKRLQVKFWKNSDYKHFYVHRLVAMAFIPNPNNLPEVNHKDFNPVNNRADNLEWMTSYDNIIDYKKAFSKTGEMHITFEKDTKKYRLRIPINGKTKFFGRYETLQKAIEAKRSIFYPSSVESDIAL